MTSKKPYGNRIDNHSGIRAGGPWATCAYRVRKPLRSPYLRARRSTPDAMDQRHTPVTHTPKSSQMIWPGCGVLCTVPMVSNNLSGIAPSKGIDGMKQLLRIYILNDVSLSRLHLLSHTEKLVLWELLESLVLRQTRGYRLYQDVATSATEPALSLQLLMCERQAHSKTDEQCSTYPLQPSTDRGLQEKPSCLIYHHGYYHQPQHALDLSLIHI